MYSKCLLGIHTLYIGPTNYYRAKHIEVSDYAYMYKIYIIYNYIHEELSKIKIFLRGRLFLIKYSHNIYLYIDLYNCILYICIVGK